MSTTQTSQYDGDSHAQREAEAEILRAVEQHLGVKLDAKPQIDQPVQLDGFHDGARPTCVEVWAHHGRAKPAQQHKVMSDFCKLLLVEKLLATPCKKVFAVCDADSMAFLTNSWKGRAAKEFGIDLLQVAVSDETRQSVYAAQQRQFR